MGQTYSMAATIPATAHTFWAVALFFSLAALLKWKHRRMVAARRINRGLRAYTSQPPVTPAP